MSLRSVRIVAADSSAGCPQPRMENDQKPYEKRSIGILSVLDARLGQPALLKKAPPDGGASYRG